MDRIDDLLSKTSRTFALSIPLLPEPTRRELGVAYLLFRIADTLEDATDWRPAQQVAALAGFVDLLRDPNEKIAAELGGKWADAVPIVHDGYLELLRATDLVVREFLQLSPMARTIIGEHTIRTARGMAGFVERADNGMLRLDDIDDLKLYCYTVAGIVGELSTELFVLGRPQLSSAAPDLRQRAAQFGEALQLVNILKDVEFDNTEGRRYLPADVDRATIFALARRDLGVAADYTVTLQRAGAPRGVVAFCALPVRLAYAALACVEERGPGSKISREQVYALVDQMNSALDADEPAVEAGVAATSSATAC